MKFEKVLHEFTGDERIDEEIDFVRYKVRTPLGEYIIASIPYKCVCG
jgi:hypothetical protein